MYRVLLVEDRFLVRQGLRRYLSHHVGIVTAGEAQNGEEAVDFADLLKPDVVVMDVSVLRKNSEGTGSLSRTHPHLPTANSVVRRKVESRNVLG